jgi:hypothetical protein
MLYNEETETISHYHVAQNAIADVIETRASFDVPLADFGHTIDDDFARKLGSTILLLLAGRNPSLKSQLSLSVIP